MLIEIIVSTQSVETKGEYQECEVRIEGNLTLAVLVAEALHIGAQGRDWNIT